MDKYSILKQYYGHSAFRAGQEELIDSILSGRDALCVMPTGGGKSLCYQLPALLLPGITLVVSPLISLMKDQVAALKSAGVPAAYINSSLTGEQIRTVYARTRKGAYKLIYVAPERLETNSFLSLMQEMDVSFLAVDEAHCISQWGQDFRPSYLGIVDFINALPRRPIVAAYTATATKQVQSDILRLLQLQSPYRIVTGFDRPNLYFDVRRPKNKFSALAALIDERRGRSGIVYCATRAAVERVCDSLCDRGIAATRYHAGLTDEERQQNQDDFQFDRKTVMVATNAFGMGIDKSNVSFVIHYNMPKSIEAYYQEAGRAGRDGVRSYALLLTSPDDGGRIVKRFEQEFPPLEKIKDIYEKVCSYLQIGIGDGAEASFLFNIHDFCAREHLYSGTVQSALKLLQQNGYMTLTDAQENPARIMFCVSRDDLYRIRVQRDELDHFIRTLLRLYNGVFTEFRQIDEGEIATWSGYTVERVKELLKRLWQLRVIRENNWENILLLDAQSERRQRTLYGLADILYYGDDRRCDAPYGPYTPLLLRMMQNEKPILTVTHSPFNDAQRAGCAVPAGQVTQRGVEEALLSFTMMNGEKRVALGRQAGDALCITHAPAQVARDYRGALLRLWV